MRGSKAGSFSSAAFLVAASIHEAFEIFSRISRAHVVDEFLRLPRRLGRPMVGDVELADRLAETVVEHVHAALPPRALLGHVVQRVAVEIEIGVVEGRRKRVGMIADEAEGEIFLPRAERHVGEGACRPR